MKTIFTQKVLKIGIGTFIFFLAFFGFSPANSQSIFSNSGTHTFVVTSQSNNVVIEVWGAGGSGGANTTTAKGGGGGGGYSRTTVNLAPGNYTVIVGKGGVATNSNGVAGGGSSFRNGSIIIDSASGGAAANGTTGGAGGNGIAVGGNGIGTTLRNGGKGGNGANGSFFGNSYGAGGGGGGSALTGSNGSDGGDGFALFGLTIGGTGGTGQGNGGNGGNNNAVGLDGATPGGGGGGKGYGDNKTNGNGANGVVKITGAIGAPLPVKLGNFQAVQKQEGVQLDWITYMEFDVSHFEIQRSSDGINFTTIGTVSAKNIISGASYSWFDSAPLNGINLYRLKSVDIDTKFEYSSIVRINLGKSFVGFNVFPNPVTNNRLSIEVSEMPKGDYSIRMYNISGNLISSQVYTHPGGPVSRNIQLPPSIKTGMYTIQLSNNESKISKTFIVQ